MATRTTKVPKHLRVRRNPEDGEREILDAAEEVLRELDFRDLTVDGVMGRTGMVRSAFYTYFESRNDLAMRLLQRIEAEMMAASATWLEQPLDDPVAGIDAGLLEVAETYARHGHVLRAIHEASYHDREVELYYRGGLIQNFIDAVAARIRAENEAGRADVDDPEAVARALLLLNSNLFVERLGGSDSDSPEAVAATLALIWRRTIYPGGT